MHRRDGRRVAALTASLTPTEHTRIRTLATKLLQHAPTADTDTGADADDKVNGSGNASGSGSGGGSGGR